MPTIKIPTVHGVYRISLAWSNCYLLKPDDCSDAWLIDTGLHGDRAELSRGLSELGVEPSQVKAVLLTHGHCDHAGSAAYFNSEFGATLYAHRDETIYLNNSRTPYGSPKWSSPFTLFQAAVFRAGERRFPVERCGHLDSLDDGKCYRRREAR